MDTEEKLHFVQERLSRQSESPFSRSVLVRCDRGSLWLTQPCLLEIEFEDEVLP